MAWVGQKGRHTFATSSNAGRRAPPPLSCRKYKNYFINNTRYTNVQLNYDIKLYTVQLVRYFGGHHHSIGVMALSIMIQQRAIVDDALCHHLSPSKRRLGALASLCHSPTFPLLHPLFIHARPLPPFGWLLHPIIPSAANQGHNEKVFIFSLHSKQFSIPILPMRSAPLHCTSSPSSSPPQPPVVGGLLCVPLSIGGRLRPRCNLFPFFIIRR